MYKRQLFVPSLIALKTRRPLNEGFYHPDVNAVAAAALDKAGRPQYVVNCGGPNLKPKMLRDELGPMVAQLASKITTALAGRSL